jgi:hypothetical protein
MRRTFYSRSRRLILFPLSFFPARTGAIAPARSTSAAALSRGRADPDDIDISDDDMNPSLRSQASRPATAGASYRGAAAKPAPGGAGGRRRVYDESMDMSVSVSDENIGGGGGGGDEDIEISDDDAPPPRRQAAAASWEDEMADEFGDERPPPRRAATAVPIRSAVPARAPPRHIEHDREEIEIDIEEDEPPPRSAPMRQTLAKPKSHTEDLSISYGEDSYEIVPKPAPAKSAYSKPQPRDDEIEIDFEDEPVRLAPKKSVVPVKQLVRAAPVKMDYDGEEVEIEIEDDDAPPVRAQQQKQMIPQNKTPIPAAVRPVIPPLRPAPAHVAEEEEEIVEEDEDLQSPRTKAALAAKAAAAAAQQAKAHLAPPHHQHEDSYSDEWGSAAVSAIIPQAAAAPDDEYYEDDMEVEPVIVPPQQQQYSIQVQPPAQTLSQPQVQSAPVQSSVSASSKSHPNRSSDPRRSARESRSRHHRSRSRSRSRGRRRRSRSGSDKSYAERSRSRSRSRSRTPSDRSYTDYSSAFEQSPRGVRSSVPSSSRRADRSRGGRDYARSSHRSRPRTIEMACQTDPLSLSDLLGPGGSSLLVASSQPYVIQPHASPMLNYTTPLQYGLQPSSTTRTSTGVKDDPDRHLYPSALADPATRFAYPSHAPFGYPGVATTGAYGFPQPMQSYPHSAYDYPVAQPLSNAAPAQSASAAASASASATAAPAAVASSSYVPSTSAFNPSHSSPSVSASHSTTVFKSQIASILSTIEACRNSIFDPQPLQAYPGNQNKQMPVNAWGADLQVRKQASELRCVGLLLLTFSVLFLCSSSIPSGSCLVHSTTRVLSVKPVLHRQRWVRRKEEATQVSKVKRNQISK